MVEYLSTEKPIHTKKIGLYFSSSVWIEAGSAITTVDHSDMRGLAAARFGIVTEMPGSNNRSYGHRAYSEKLHEDYQTVAAALNKCSPLSLPFPPSAKPEPLSCI